MLALAGCISFPAQPATQNPGTPDISPDVRVEALALRLLESFPVQVQAVVRGRLADGCVSIERIGSDRRENTFAITIQTNRQTEGDCGEAAATFEEVVSLDVTGLPAGQYEVVAGKQSGRFRLEVDNTLLTPGPESEPATPDPNATPTFERVTTPTAASAAASGSARALLAQALQAAPEDVEVVSVEATTWPDGCLGLGGANEGCLAQVTPGFRVRLRFQDKVYVYRTDDRGIGARPDPEATELASRPPCANKLEFVQDVSVPDGATMAPGKTFVKTWRVRNSGTCTWTPEYSLVFDGGEQMGAVAAIALPEAAAPGETIDVSAPMTAPLRSGDYEGLWKVAPPDGPAFGTGEAKRPFWVRIKVPADATATPVPTGSSIGGRIWHDLCRPQAAEGEAAVPLPSGCVQQADGAMGADGVHEAAEPAIAGPEVRLGSGPCPADDLAVALANGEGRYVFEGLTAGAYCVSLDPLSDYNLTILVPGGWTYPLDGKGMQTVTVDGVKNAIHVDFGWDYQFAP